MLPAQCLRWHLSATVGHINSCFAGIRSKMIRELLSLSMFQVEVYAVVDGHLFLIGPAELRHLRWMMHMADQEVRGGQISMAFCAFCYHFHTHHMPCSVSNKLQVARRNNINNASY